MKTKSNPVRWITIDELRVVDIYTLALANGSKREQGFALFIWDFANDLLEREKVRATPFPKKSTRLQK